MGGAIAAGGKTINFDKKTIVDNKTGVKSSFSSTKRGIIIRPNVTSIRTNTAREIQKNPELIKQIGIEKSREIIKAQQQRDLQQKSQEEQIQANKRTELLKNNKLDFLNKVLLDSQKKNLINQLSRRSFSDQREFAKKLQDIDRKQNLNVLQKENAKRRLIGLNSIVVQNNLFKKKVKEAVTPKQINNVDSNLFNKVTTGQTITPQELRRFNSQIKTNQKDLTSQQINKLKKFPVGVVVGFAKEGFDLLSFLVNGGLISIKSTGNYIKNLPSRSKQQKLRIDQVVNRDLLLLEKKVNKAGQTFNNFSKEMTIYVKKNPGKSFLIVSNAVASGMDTGLREFDKNPGEVTGRALFWFKGDKILKGGVKVLQKSEKFIFSPKASKSLQAQIKALENIKNLTREQKILLKDLRKLAQVDKELIKIKNNLSSVTNITKVKGKPKYNKSNFDKITKAKKETTKIEKVVKKKNNLVKKTKFKTLDSLQIGKLFRKFINEKEKKIIIQIKKGLPKTEKALIKLLKEARKTSGKAFAELKKKIKKDFGLNVVQRGSGKNLTFKLLQPKKQAKKGVKTARPKTKRFIVKNGKIIPEPKLKPKPKPKERKLTKKERKDLEFKEGQNIDKLQKDIRSFVDFLKDNEASFPSKKFVENKLKNKTNRFYNKQIKQSKKVQKDVQKFINRYHPNKTINPRNPRTQSFTNWTKEDRLRYTREKKKISNAVKETSKNLSKTRSKLGLKVLKAFGIFNIISSVDLSILKKSNIELNKQDSLFKKLQVQINKFKNPIPQKPKPKIQKGKKQPIKKTTTKPRAKPKPKIKPKGKVRKIKRTIKPKKTIKKRIKLKLDFRNPKLKNRVLIFEGKFRERKFRNKPANKKNNPVITKTIRFKTTENRMLNKVQTLADNRLVRSVEIKIVSATNRKVKDVKLNARSKKFRRKLSSNSKVLRLVEKSKFISDTKGEKRELKRSRRIGKKRKVKKNRGKKK